MSPLKLRRQLHTYSGTLAEVLPTMDKYHLLKPNGPVYALFDTCAITTLYTVFGDDFLTLPKTLGSVEPVIPRRVIEELERQQNGGRRNDAGRALVPHDLINYLYTAHARGFHEEIYVDLSSADKKRLTHALRTGAPEKQNVRLGDADAALLKFGLTFPEDLSIIITCDSDIPMTLKGLDTIVNHHLDRHKPRRAEHFYHGATYLHPRDIIISRIKEGQDD